MKEEKDVWIDSFIHSIVICRYQLRTFLGTRDTVVNKTERLGLSPTISTPRDNTEVGEVEESDKLT